MPLLLVSIVCLAGLAICLRQAADQGAQAATIHSIYRFGTGIMSLVLTIAALHHADWRALWSAVWVHALVGALFFWLSGLSSVRAVQTGPLGVTWTVVRLSMLIPTMASILFWHELPLFPPSLLLLLRGAGILLGTCAVVLLGIDLMRRQRQGTHVPHPNHHLPTWGWWLATAFLMQGAWETTLRAAGSFPTDQHRTMMLGAVFFINLLMAIPVLAMPKYRPRPRDWSIGAVASVFALLGSGLRPWILRDLPGTVVFPVTAIGVTLLVLLASVWWWKEKLGRWGVTGIVLSLLAAVLLNVYRKG